MPSADPRLTALTAIPNVGPAVARRLLALEIEGPDDLRGRDADELFERLCALEGRREDPCLLDTFAAAVAWADGGPARPWWEFSRERKARRDGRLSRIASARRARAARPRPAARAARGGRTSA